ncbi:MAG: chemotaxis protein CheW [Formivibrio sp.]|nr:chemotaxis protein CheW [Formivibrio sp.]
MSKRFSLREYQESMLGRMKVATATSQADARLGIEVGGRNWLVDLADAAEVLPVPKITGVPLAQAWFCGVANVRGNLLSVVDLQAFWGEGAQTLTPLSRILPIHPRILSHSALLVGRMQGIKHLANMTRLPGLTDAPVWCGTQYRDDGGQDWCELDIKRLAVEPAFLQTGIIA